MEKQKPKNGSDYARVLNYLLKCVLNSLAKVEAPDVNDVAKNFQSKNNL